MCVNKFIKKNEQFAYIRRYKSDLKEGSSSFFEALKSNNEFDGHALAVKR